MAKKKTSYPALWRAIKWGQIGNLIAWAVALGGASDGAALTIGALITLTVSVIGT